MPDCAESIVLQYEEMIYNIALRYLRNPQDAEDVYSETFLRYFQAERSFESEEHRKAWLIRVTINCSNDILRKRKDDLELNEEILAETKAPDTHLYDDLHDAINHLAPIYKEVIVLFYLEEIPIKKISEILNINENTIKGRLRNARALLKKALEG